MAVKGTPSSSWSVISLRATRADSEDGGDSTSPRKPNEGDDPGLRHLPWKGRTIKVSDETLLQTMLGTL